MNASLLRLKTYAEFAGGRISSPLSVLCRNLLTEQNETWDELRNGYESLKQVRVRDLCCNGFSVLLQNNAGRIRSTLARVGEKAPRDNPCFLCLDRLPDGQKGIFYRGEYLILCNPMPVFHSHLTIANVGHRPQSLGFHIGTFLQLMADFGPGWMVLYNGPRCGASAPDHLHFQAVPRGTLPIEVELGRPESLAFIAQIGRVGLYRCRHLGRETIILKGKDSDALTRVFTNVVEALREILRTEEEPMMNAAGFVTEEGWEFVVFPRRKHRPDAFFREGEGRVVVSPGAVEMAGVIVTPVETDYERLDAAAVEAIYGEVSLECGSVDRVLEIVKAASAAAPL